MPRLTLIVDDMDCPDEAAILKRALLPLVGDESRLEFDFLGRKLTVDLSGIDVSGEAVLAAVTKTGMAARPFDRPFDRLTEPSFGRPSGQPTEISLDRPSLNMNAPQTAGSSLSSGPGATSAVDALGGCACCGGTCSTASRTAERSFLVRNLRPILCAVSGAAWIIGFAVTAVDHGSVLSALTGQGSTPVLAVLLWIAASLCGTWTVFPKAARSLRALRPDMNLLMLVAVAGAVALGDFSEAACVAFLFALANELESWSVGRARRSIQALLDITPATALVLEPLQLSPVERRVEDVVPGTRILVRPGSRVPLDGVVRAGESALDQSPLTGESIPVSKGPGDQVLAGSINADGALEVETTRPASDTTLARILHMVEAAQSRRAKAAQLVEKFAAVYTPAMIILALLVALIPPIFLGGSFGAWFYQALVVLVISCPCALVISTPVSVVASLASAARNGVLVKGGAYLEAPARITAVAMDKTGTLTLGTPEVATVAASPGIPENDLLAVAAALESRSTHPLARAILRHTSALGVAQPPVTEARNHPGRGAQGAIGGLIHYAGNERLLRETAPHLLTSDLAIRLDEHSRLGRASVILWTETAVLGLISLEDRVRPEAAEAVRQLAELGVRQVVMLTGDNEHAAAAIAHQAGVAEFRAGLMPEDKTRFVAELAERNPHVAMVGDGVNDAPALAASSLGVAMGAVGSDVAIETADVALMSDDLLKLPWLIRHSRRTLNTIKANITFALGLKAIFLVLAFLDMATLWTAIMADMGASLVVIFNGLRLLRIRK